MFWITPKSYYTIFFCFSNHLSAKRDTAEREFRRWVSAGLRVHVQMYQGSALMSPASVLHQTFLISTKRSHRFDVVSKVPDYARWKAKIYFSPPAGVFFWEQQAKPYIQQQETFSIKMKLVPQGASENIQGLDEVAHLDHCWCSIASQKQNYISQIRHNSLVVIQHRKPTSKQAGWEFHSQVSVCGFWMFSLCVCVGSRFLSQSTDMQI